MRTNMTRETGVTEEDWSACQKAFFKLALKYPKSLLRERMGVFYNTLRQRKDRYVEPENRVFLVVPAVRCRGDKNTTKGVLCGQRGGAALE